MGFRTEEEIREGRELLRWARQRLERSVTWKYLPEEQANPPAPQTAAPPPSLPQPRARPDSNPDWSAGLGLGASRDEDLLAKVADEALLLRVWQELWEDATEDGYEPEEVRKFGLSPLFQLGNLREALLEQSWRPEPTSSFQVGPQRRVIRVSAVPDRIVERALVAVLAPIIDGGLSPFSFGYRAGMGVADAVAAVSRAGAEGAQFVLRADIAHAFDEVPRARVLGMLSERIADVRVVGMVAMLLARLDDAGADGIGIPQGSSISPMMLNLYLDGLDRELLGLGYQPIHYADDYAIPVSSADDGLALVDHLASALAGLGLRLNESKTDIVAFADGVTFLGQRLLGTGDPSLHPRYSHPRRISVFITGPGALCRLATGRIRVDRDGQTVQAIALVRVRQLVVSGRVGLTTPLLHAAAASGVDVVLVNDVGGYVGRLSRRRGGDVRVRQAQFRTADSQDASLALARIFVADKIANMRVAVLRGQREPNWAGRGAGTAAASLEAAAGCALSATNPASLMGIEGSATRSYFQWISDNLDNSWGFVGRNRRPPRDPVNAMLSYCYTLLSAELVTACEIAHLDPDMGFLHSPRWGRPALALDLMEQWRPVLVDQLVLRLVAHERVTPIQFVISGGDGCRMQPEARKTLLQAYEHRMLTLAHLDSQSGRRAFRELLGIDAGRLGAALLAGEPGDYRGYRWR